MKLVRWLAGVAIALVLPACGGGSSVGVDSSSASGSPGPTGSGSPGGPGAPSGGSGPGGTPSGGMRAVGYFAQWAIYSRNYFILNVASSGAASRMTHLNYAFANVTSSFQTATFDAYADYQKVFTAAESVDGQADTWSQPLAGNFNQLRKLKLLYPGLKIMISLGGWTLSTNFSAAAATAQSRQTLASSAVSMYLQGNFAPGIQAPGIFDGIDIDWEYPAANGNGQPYSPSDTQNYTALLAELRSQLDAQSQQDGRPYYLSIAAPAGADKFSKIQLSDLHPYVDWINLMAYDFHGAWETVTNFSAPLYSNSSDPEIALNYWADYAVEAYLAAGIPSGKIVLGIPLYGRGWTGVPPGPSANGLFQTASGGAAPGVWQSGINDYKVLAPLVTATNTFRDPQSQAFWIYDGTTFWTFDDVTAVGAKTAYIKAKSLGGAMFWELDGDDPSGTLVDAIVSGLK